MLFERWQAGGTRTLPIDLTLLIVAALLIAWCSFIGYLQSDDFYYAIAAKAWLRDGFYLADSHWGLRHVLVLPIALSFRLFGVSELSLVLPTFLYFVGCALIAYFAIRAWHGRMPALLAALSILLTPLLAGTATTVFADLPEAFWIVASLLCVIAARQRGGDLRMAVLAGFFAALGWITRETTLAYLAFLGICFLISPGMPRPHYFAMAGGFFFVLAIDTFALWLASGDPLYRFNITMKGVAGDNPVETQYGPRGGFDRHGNVDMPRWLLPIGMMLLQQKFGLLYFIAVPIWLWLCFGRTVDPAIRTTARVLGGAALAWFVILSYILTSLWVQNRYQTVTTIAAAIVIGLGITALYRARRRALALSVAALVVVNSLLMLALENDDQLFGEKILTEWSANRTEPITTDANTRSTAQFLLEAAGSSGRVSAGTPSPGSLYFFNSAPRRGPPRDRPVPQPGWVVVATAVSPEKPLSGLLRRSGVLRFVPPGIALKLAPPPKQAVLYRLP